MGSPCARVASYGTVWLGIVVVDESKSMRRAYVAESLGFAGSSRMRKVDRASRIFGASEKATRESGRDGAWMAAAVLIAERGSSQLFKDCFLFYRSNVMIYSSDIQKLMSGFT